MTERAAELGWGDLSPLNASPQSVPQVCVQYEEEDGDGERTEEEVDGKEGTGRSVSSRVGGMRVPVSLSARGANMTGLAPGRLYSVSLTASDPAGASWSLGRIHTVHTRTSTHTQAHTRSLNHSVTHSFMYKICIYFDFFLVLLLTYSGDVYTCKSPAGPIPPQNVSVGNITTNQITVHWVAPESQHAERWKVIVRWVDMSSGQERVEGVHNVSRRSGIGGRQTYSAVIGQLESFRKYKVGVHTVTEGEIGRASCRERV